MSTVDGLGSIMTLISLARCPSQTRTVRVCWRMSATAAWAMDLRYGPPLYHPVLPEGNAKRLSREPHFFLLARLTVVLTMETYFPKPSPTDTGLRVSLCPSDTLTR